MSLHLLMLPLSCAQVPGMRKWLKFERSGRTEILQVDKQAIALQTGVQVLCRCQNTSCVCATVRLATYVAHVLQSKFDIG